MHMVIFSEPNFFVIPFFTKELNQCQGSLLADLALKDIVQQVFIVAIKHQQAGTCIRQGGWGVEKTTYWVAGYTHRTLCTG